MSGGVGRNVQTSEIRLTGDDQTGQAFRSAAANAERLRREMERTTSMQSVMFQRMAGGAAGLERRLTAATAAMGFGETLRSGITEFAAMDRRMTRLAQNAEQTKGVIGSMKKELIDLANETGQSIEEVISGFELYVSQTGNYKEAAAQIRNIAIANQGLGAEMKETAQTARILADQLKIAPGDDTMKAFDMFAAGTRLGAFEAKHFAQYMPILAQAMEQAGMRGFDGLSKMVTAMELIQKVSPDQERAVLGFRDLISKAFQPEVQNKFKSAGVNMLGELQKTQREGGDVLATIVSATDEALSRLARAGGVAEREKYSLIPQLFGEIDSQRAITGLLKYKDVFAGSQREIINSLGETKRRYSEVNRDTSASLTQLENKWNEFKQQTGKSLIEAGALGNIDKFAKDVDYVIAQIDRLGSSINRIMKNPMSIFSEIGGYAITEMHAELERVTRLSIASAEKNIKEYRERAESRRQRGQPYGAAQMEEQAQAEEKRLERLRYQLKHGFSFDRLTGNTGSDNKTPGSIDDGVRAIIEGKATPETVRRAQERVPALPPSSRVMPSEMTPQQVETAAEIAQQRLNRLREETEIKRGEYRDLMQRRSTPDDRAPIPDSAIPERYRGKVDIVPGPENDFGGAKVEKQSFDASEFARLIHRANVVETTGQTTDRAPATERGQIDANRSAARTNELLRDLIQLAHTRRGVGDDEGIGSGHSDYGGSNGGGGGGSSGSIGGGSPGSGDRSGGGGGGSGSGPATGVPVGAGAGPGAYKSLLDHIAGAEGTANQPGGGYNTSLGYGKFLPGGKEQNLTGKTLNEILALGDGMRRVPGNPNSSALGRYQIVGKTLRGLMRKLGLKGDEKFDEAMQDRLGAELAKQRGANASLGDEWASLRGARLRKAMELAGAIPRGSSTEPGPRPSEDVAAAPGGDTGGEGGRVHERQQGGIRNQPITPELKSQLEKAAADSEVEAEVFSGGQDSHGSHRTGSHRHDHGKSADIRLYRTDANGKRQYLSMNNPEDRKVMQKFLRRSVRHGATGIGAGPGYMGDKGMHVGGGPPMAWGRGGRAANAPEWVNDALREGMADRARPENDRPAVAGDDGYQSVAGPEQTPRADQKPQQTPRNDRVSAADQYRERMQHDLNRQMDQLARHRAEVERPIKIRYETEGMNASKLGGDSIHARRAADASFRNQRYNSYSDTGVAVLFIGLILPAIQRILSMWPMFT